MDELFTIPSKTEQSGWTNHLPHETSALMPAERSLVETFKSSEITILLIDDQEFVGEVIQRLLAAETDISLHHCLDPREAFQLAINNSPMVILLDLVMPEIDGLLLLRWLRRHPVTCDIPVVILSATEEPELKAKAFTQGANDYLIKLPGAPELIARIRYHARAYQNLQGMAVATQVAQTQAQQLEQTLQTLQTTQAQLIQAGKLAGLEQLVAGMAHEINNPINFIYGNLTYAQEYIEQLLQVARFHQKNCSTVCSQMYEADIMDIEFIAEDLPRLLTSMKAGVDRVRQIISSLRNFSHLDQAELKAVNIHEGLESTLLILQHRLATRSTLTTITVIKEYGDLPLIECYPAQLNQVFMNILSNAIDAIEEIRPQAGEAYAGQIHIRTQISDRSTVMIQISDNGCGIPEAIQSRIFEPFFTTKSIGRGIGLGLSSSYQIIVNQHDGVLKCISTLQQGTTIGIEIPCRIRSER